MPYPPTTPPTTRTNATAQLDAHASDHNVLAQAVKDILTELGNDPSGVYASLTARLAAITTLVVASPSMTVGTDGSGNAVITLPAGAKYAGGAANGGQPAFPHFWLTQGTAGAAVAVFQCRNGGSTASAVTNSTVTMGYIAAYTL